MAKKGFFAEFKEFIAKGNVIDMAIGVVIGGAFKDIVNSLVANVITPAISLLTGKSSFEELVWVLKEGAPAELAEDGSVLVEEVLPVTIGYGVFIQRIIDFIIIALTIFVVIKVVTALKNRSEALIKKLDAEKYAAEEKKAAEEAAKKAEEEAKAAAEAEVEKAELLAVRKAQKDTVVLLAEIKEILGKK